MSARVSTFSKRGLAATLGIALLMLLALELRFPYYFLQDDGLEYFLPAWLHNWRSLRAGALPLYNFHTFAGIPHASMAQPGSFYLPSYVALALSKILWGHPFATLDISSILHGLLAVAGAYVLFRYIGTSNTAAAFGALTTFSGFFIWAGRMWPFVPALCAYFPWMLWASLRFFAQPDAKRAAPVMFFRLGLLYTGYPQYFVLATIFEHLFTLGCAAAHGGDGFLRRSGKYLLLNLPVLLLGLPFLLPVSAEIGRSLERATILPYAEFSGVRMSPLEWLVGQLLVFLPINLRPDAIESAVPYLSQIGFLPALLSVGAVALWKKVPKTRFLIAPAALCFFLALLWAWNLLAPFLYHVPLLNRFRFPFKLVYFAGFFQCVLATLVVARWSKRWQFIAVVAFLLNWAWVFCFLPNHAWRTRAYHPPLQSPWQEELKTGRYIIIDSRQTPIPPGDFAHFNYSLLWGFDNLLGYEPMVSGSNAQVALWKGRPDLHIGSYTDPISPSVFKHLKQWSIRFVLLSTEQADVSRSLIDAGFQKRATRGMWALWEDPNFLPRVRPAKHASGMVARWAVYANSIDVTFDEWRGGELLLAFAANPGLQTCVENHCTPITASSDGMIHVYLPPRNAPVTIDLPKYLVLPGLLGCGRYGRSLSCLAGLWTLSRKN